MTLTPEQLRETCSALRDAMDLRYQKAEEAESAETRLYWQNEQARAETLLAQLEGRDKPKAEKGVNPSGKVKEDR